MFIYKKKNLDRNKGFTLMELLIYSGILVISAGLITGIVYTVNRSNQKVRVEEELSNQAMILEEVLRQKIQAAKRIKSISGSFLKLEMDEGEKTPTEFSLIDETIFLQEGKGSSVGLNNKAKVKVASLMFSPTGPETTNVSNIHHYAWSGNVGWIDFTYPGGNVQVPTKTGELKGAAYILSDKSWIALNCLTTNSCASVDYKVSLDEDGKLKGWGWSENYGWVSFSCVTGGANSGNICNATNYGVAVDPETGEFDGYAWSEYIGWISFNCKTGCEIPNKDGCVGYSICSVSDYKVQDLRMSTSAIKIELNLEYNSSKPELNISRLYTFVFSLGSSSLVFVPVTTTTTTTIATTTTTITTTTTLPPWACGNSITFTYRGSSEIYGTVLSKNKCWMDRNLGASRIAGSSNDVSAYGDLFQWGRGADGHQIRTSGMTAILSSSDNPGHSNFITPAASPYDWRSPQNPNLWQGVNGINNPCPEGWRVPTSNEWDNELDSWGTKNSVGAFGSSLKLPVTYYRHRKDGAIFEGEGIVGRYWTTTLAGGFAQMLAFDSTSAIIKTNDTNGHGMAIRCILDE
ncbi:MAG: FISUMP domain-containing protein [Candidatus Pacebacteria bacterium]|jgi:uncharacterized protein (TIGR02145 family)|nr:FISUMP domain-containing protein [Candidatus Paceibacterota bacterium]MDD5721819.1 FISUMP domain-containing protein [Candidatus Paceibacterota bacterium]